MRAAPTHIITLDKRTCDLVDVLVEFLPRLAKKLKMPPIKSFARSTQRRKLSFTAPLKAMISRGHQLAVTISPTSRPRSHTLTIIMKEQSQRKNDPR